jgi:hypothetical protein
MVQDQVLSFAHNKLFDSRTTNAIKNMVMRNFSFRSLFAWLAGGKAASSTIGVDTLGQV